MLRQRTLISDLLLRAAKDSSANRTTGDLCTELAKGYAVAPSTTPSFHPQTLQSCLGLNHL